MGVTLTISAWALGALSTVVIAGTVFLLRSLQRCRRQLEITAREAEKFRSMVKERAERVSVFSHEVRTPLALIQGASELLAEGSPGPLNSRQRQFIATITDNSQGVIDLAENLLVEARIEATLFDVHLVRTDLRALVRQTVRELRQIQDTEIRLDSRGAPVRLALDRRLMRQALWNLINNAVRHAGEEHITVRVTDGEKSALIAVSDEGPGIALHDQKKLFSPFVTGTSRRPGAGLGMAITQRIAEAHGGRIFVDSVQRRGTTILMYLPIVGE